MKHEKHLSKLRNILLQVQGQSLIHVLLRAAKHRAENIADNVFTVEEIFSALEPGIYKHTDKLSQQACFDIVSDLECLSEIKDALIETPLKPFLWEETLYVLLENVDDYNRKILEPLLVNQYHYLESAETFNDKDVFSGLKALTMRLAHRVYKDMSVRNLVGFQPMQAPVGKTFFLQYSEEDPETKKCKRLDNPSFTDGKKITMNIVSDATEACTKKLQAGWTLETQQDLKAYHGLDIETEMILALSSEIRTEITHEIVNDLKVLAGKPEIVSLEGEESSQIQKLHLLINHAANDIARDTRRGAGNWVVVSPLIANTLKLDERIETETAFFETSGGLLEIGTLNKSIKVFSMMNFSDNEMLVGYKGGSGECDTGYVHAPYIPVLSSGIVVHPETFQPIVSLMTRYGKQLNGGMFEKGEDHLSRLYYKLITFESDVLLPKKE